MPEITKEMYEVHKEMMIRNLIADQTVYNTDNREQFYDYMGIYGYLLEEVEETTEALEQLNSDLKELWNCIRNNASKEHINSKLELIVGAAKEVLAEATDVAAVAQKALIQLESKKAPITDQSK